MNTKQYIILKDGIDVSNLLHIHPHLLEMLAWVSAFCHAHNVTCVVTSIIRSIEENKRLKSKSSTHVEGRAIDISLRPQLGWTLMLIKKFEEEFTKAFYDYGALVPGPGRTLIRRPIVIHNSVDKNGNEVGIDHAHLQVAP